MSSLSSKTIILSSDEIYLFLHLNQPFSFSSNSRLSCSKSKTKSYVVVAAPAAAAAAAAVVFKQLFTLPASVILRMFQTGAFSIALLSLWVCSNFFFLKEIV